MTSNRKFTEKPNRLRTASTAKVSGVAAVERAFAILNAFGNDGQSMPLATIAANTGMYKSTILRLMDSLIRFGYLQRLEGGNYQIGPTPMILGARYQRSLRVGDLVLPYMRALAQETGESLSLYVVHGSSRLCVHRIDSDHEIRDHVREGDLYPMDRGSGGGVLSAFSGARGARYDSIRANYFYISLGERDRETGGISAPIFGAENRLLGSLTLSGPRSRVDQAFLNKVRPKLLLAAARATASLGGDPRPLERVAKA